MTTAEKILQKKTVYKNEMDKIMPAEQSEKLLADTLTLYLLGQIVPLRFDSGSSYNSNGDSKGGTRRDFSDAGSILFDAGSDDDVRNFTKTCEAFAKAIIGGNSGA